MEWGGHLPRQVGPVADVGEPEALHDLMQVFHVLAGERVHVLAPEAVLHEELVKLLDFIAGSECPESVNEKILNLSKCVSQKQ